VGRLGATRQSARAREPRAPGWLKRQIGQTLLYIEQVAENHISDLLKVESPLFPGISYLPKCPCALMLVTDCDAREEQLRRFNFILLDEVPTRFIAYGNIFVGQESHNRSATLVVVVFANKTNRTKSLFPVKGVARCQCFGPIQCWILLTKYRLHQSVGYSPPSESLSIEADSPPSPSGPVIFGQISAKLSPLINEL
jgi:hypothetical protein